MIGVPYAMFSNMLLATIQPTRTLSTLCWTIALALKVDADPAGNGNSWVLSVLCSLRIEENVLIKPPPYTQTITGRELLSFIPAGLRTFIVKQSSEDTLAKVPFIGIVSL